MRRKKWMEEPLTEELLDELLSSPDPKSFISKNEIGQRSLAEYLQKLLEEKGLKRSDVVKAAGINETFGYQIFTGKRHASRDKVLQLAFAMHLNLRETDRLLQAAGVNELYCKNRRDAIIIFAVNKGYSLQQPMKSFTDLARKLFARCRTFLTTRHIQNMQQLTITLLLNLRGRVIQLQRRYLRMNSHRFFRLLSETMHTPLKR